jgi:hypothetical protein
MFMTSREIATTLAALRYWERTVSVSPEHFDDEDTPLDDVEIDQLCERLNVSDDLTPEQRQKAHAEASALYASDDIEIDDEPEFSRGEDGIWVQGWLWVADDDEDEPGVFKSPSDNTLWPSCGDCGGKLDADGDCPICGDEDEDTETGICDTCGASDVEIARTENGRTICVECDEEENDPDCQCGSGEECERHPKVKP